MTTKQWKNITDYMDTVGTTLKTFTFNKTQNLVKVTIRGNANVTYAIGSQSGTLTPGQSITVSELITSFNLTAVSGIQTVEVWAIEDGTTKIESNGNSLDDVIASLATTVKKVNNITPDSNGNVTVTFSATDTNARNRSRNNKRRTVFKNRSKYVLPSAFTTLWNPPINVYNDGLTFYTDFDVTKYKNVSARNIYVSPTLGTSSNDGLSLSTPCQSFLKAYQLANDGDTIIAMDGIYYRSASWQNQRIQKNINIIAQNTGKAIIPYADVLTYTLSAGTSHVYQVARGSVGKVIDITLDTYGIPYVKATSIADCDAKEGSWYTDGTTLYVHAIGGLSPDNSKVFVLLQGQHFYANSDTQAVTYYLEGLTIYGGMSNVIADCTNNNISIYGKNVIGLHASQSAGIEDAFDINGVNNAYFQNCIAAYSEKDGFNYTANNIANAVKNTPHFIEVNCQGFSNGLANAIAGAENTNNGSTSHVGSMGIRVNCTYFNNMGSNCADVQTNTKTITLGCYAFDSACTLDSAFATNFCAQQGGAEMWLDGCVAFGSKYDIYPVSGTTMHIWNTEYDTTQGGGVFDIINPL